jgi:HEPN domain-containing protein
MDELIQEWIRKAENDLLNVENNLNSIKVPTDTVCFHCQQVAEKYLKAYLVYKNITFPKIHNLLRLLELCKQADSSFEDLRENLLILNEYNTEVRYPVDWPEPALEEAKESYKIAKRIEQFIGNRIISDELEN